MFHPCKKTPAPAIHAGSPDREKARFIAHIEKRLIHSAAKGLARKKGLRRMLAMWRISRIARKRAGQIAGEKFPSYDPRNLYLS